MTGPLVPTCSLVALVAGLLAGCFSGPINQPPTVETMQPPMLFRGETASIPFVASDPDDDQLTVKWGSMPGPCPAVVTDDNWRGGRDDATVGQPLPVGSEMTDSQFCVCTFVNDSHGAARQSCITVTPLNRAPEHATILVIKPTVVPLFALYSAFRLSAAADDPDHSDQVTFGDWTFIAQPPGSKAALDSCPNPGDPDQCFTADQAGEYKVAVAARDGHGGEVIANRTLVVDGDRLPCLGTTIPAIDQKMRSASSTETVRFEVITVDDDGDSSLSGPDRIHFTWWEGPSDGPLINQGNDLSVFSRVPEPTLVGLTRRVRVEIRDRNEEKIRLQLGGCQDADICLADGRSGCFLRTTWWVAYK